MTDAYAGPAWDNTTEYPSLAAPELEADMERARVLVAQLDKVSAKVAPFVTRAEALSPQEATAVVGWCQEAFVLGQEAEVLLWNVEVFINCELSVDGRNAAAKTLQAKARAAGAKLESAYNPVNQFLKLTSDAVVEEYLKSPKTAPERFLIAERRKLKAFTLSLAEEDLLIGLTVDGPTAWGTLYDNLSGSIECTLALPGGARKVGLAEAASLQQSESEDVRRAAFRGVQEGWQGHEEAVASVLNSLSGWRHEVYRRRSHKQPMRFLDDPLHRARISQKTLDAMFGAVKEVRPAAQKALAVMAKALGKDRLAPWDLTAPAPQTPGIGGWQKPSFAEAVNVIADAYGTIDPAMGQFVRMMAERSWIEGRVGGTKRPGAYCTEYPKSRTPRVYMTYNGGMRELKTLAHELGHAFHAWVLRDMPLVEIHYPMTLAETASIFGEACVDGALLARATPADRLTFCWSAAREVETFLLNIPARFTFERNLYEKRKDSTFTPADLKALMTESWTEWYGDSLTEMDPMFWASKLHFSIPSLSFYNFPYTFGYLFALGVYAQRQRLGDKFYPSYVALLRDTGRMSAEEVARKHLGADLTQPDFWRQSLKIALGAVDRLEEAVKAAGK